MPGKHWTDDEVKQLIRLAKTDLPYSEICRIMNRGYKSVQGRALKLGLRVRRSPKSTRGFWTDEKVEQLKKLVALGHSAASISDMIGAAGKNAVLGKIWRLQIDRPTQIHQGRYRPTRPKRQIQQTFWTPDRLNELKGFVEKGYSSRHIAKIWGYARSSGAIRAKGNKMGLRFSGKGGGSKPGPRPRHRRPDNHHPFLMPRIPFVEAGRNHCGYPLWGENESIGDVCGCSKEPDKPYCSHHMKRAYIPGSALSRDKWDRYTTYLADRDRMRQADGQKQST